MLKRNARVLWLVGFLLATGGAPAQEESRFLQPTASLSGNTGLWKVHSADNLPPGQASFSLWLDRINRNPGYLTITTFGFGGSAGLTRWLEFGANFEVNRRILARRQDQLSFGQQELGLFGAQVPGAPPLPGELIRGSTILPQLRSPATRTGSLTGAAGYYNMFPFAGRHGSNGVGPVNLGLKFNLLSESQGNRLGLGFRTYAVIPTHRSAQFLRARSAQSGGWQWGVDLLASKNVAELADLHLNAGFRGLESPDNGRVVELSDVMPLGIGIAIPRTTRFQVLSEFTADVLVGDRTPNTSFDNEDVVDFTIGFRAFLNRYLNLSAGYRHPLNQSGGDKNGFVFQLGYTYGPPEVVTPPSPPSLSCSADPSEVTVGQLVRLSAQGTSSTGAPLTYQWSTTGGTLEGSGQTVQLRTEGLAPGSYVATVRATEAPGLFADCSTRVTVVQPPPAPLPPTVSLSADRTRVQVGEVVNFTAQASSPQNRPLTYQWFTTGGRVEGMETRARFDTTGLQPGSYTVRVQVTDDRNLSAEDSEAITVVAPPPPPPPPQTALLDTCQFSLNSARVDNVCKAKLDNIALRLQSEPDATLAMVGSAATAERNAQQLAQTRADNVRAYLVTDKGIAEGRLNSRTGALGTGDAARKVDLHLVPRGATFRGYNLLLDRQRMESVRAAAQSAPIPVNRTPGKRIIIASLR